MKLLFSFLIIASIFTIISCSVPTIKTTTSWVNKDKVPLPEPINSLFIIALTDNREVRINLENEVAAAAQKKGITTYKSVEVIGPVDLKMIAPVKDVFLNIAGGLKVEDPSIDLAVLCALLSSYEDVNIPHQVCFAGEVGLSGEIRAVNRIDQRISEAEKLGFEKIIVSKYNQKGLNKLKTTQNIEIVTMGQVEEVYKYLF